MVTRWRCLGIAVVFADKDHRQFPDGRQVHGLVHRALRGSAVSKEADGHLIRSFDLGSQARATGQRAACADDPVRAQHTFVYIGDVHRAAFALVGAAGAAEQLAHHLLGVRALG
jgi:hypothetical protein